MADKKITLQTIKSSLKPISVRNKQVEIEKRNLAASIVIKAHEKISKSDSESVEIAKIKASVVEQIKNGSYELEVYLGIFDKRISALNRKVELIKEEKDKNDGFLKAGKITMLQQFSDGLKKAKEEKEAFLKNYNNDKAETQIIPEDLNIPEDLDIPAEIKLGG